MIAAAERTKAASDAAAKVEADARAEDIRANPGIGTNEGRTCFKSVRQTKFINWDTKDHNQEYVPCVLDKTCRRENPGRLCDAFGCLYDPCTGDGDDLNFDNAASGLCDYCGPLGKCCKQGGRVNGCSGNEGGEGGVRRCVAGESDAVKKAASAATGKFKYFLCVVRCSVTRLNVGQLHPNSSGYIM